MKFISHRYIPCFISDNNDHEVNDDIIYEETVLKMYTLLLIMNTKRMIKGMNNEEQRINLFLKEMFLCNIKINQNKDTRNYRSSVL